MFKNILVIAVVGSVFGGRLSLADEESCKKTDLGKEYRGKVSKTRGGDDCQRWDSQTPHSHRFSQERNPDAGLSENFCRNPDGEPDGPWCYTTSSDKRWEYCDVPSCVSDTCKETVLGKEYRGNVATTKNGLKCQRWDEQAPHKHIRTADNYIHAGLSEDYCRNPDGESEGPWCYTTAPDVRWEYCTVPMCVPGPLSDSGVIRVEGKVKLADYDNSKEGESCLVVTFKEAIYCIETENCPDTTIAKIVEPNPEIKDGAINYSLYVNKKLQPNRYLIGAVWNRGWCHASSSGSKEWIREGDFFNDVEHSITVDAGKGGLYKKDIDVKKFVKPVLKDYGNCSEVKCDYYGECQMSDDGSPKCVCILGCPLIFKPVCGSDGKTYANLCLLKYESCSLKNLISVAKQGSCQQNDKLTGPCELKKQKVLAKFPIINGQRMPLLGAFVPQCKGDGSYKEVQCHGSTGYCWCVDENGKKKEGSEVRFEKPECSKGRGGASGEQPIYVKGNVKLNATSSAVAVPGSCLVLKLREAIYCVKLQDCPDTTVATAIVRNPTAVDGSIPYQLKVTAKLRPNRYLIEAVWNRGWCYEDGKGDTWIKNGDFFNDVEHSVDINPAESRIYDADIAVIEFKKRVVIEIKDPDNCLFQSCEFGECDISAGEPQCVCQKACPLTFKPVCGSDGKDYANECILKYESCLLKKRISVAKQGPCKDECEKPCPRNLDPTCGSDGNTYDNDCLFEIGKCKNSSLEEAFKGECKDGQKTKCQMARDGTVLMPGAYVPQCEDDGSYKPVQCHWSTGYCWCVDENGAKIEGTSVRFEQPNCSPRNITKCELERDSQLQIPGRFLPQCESDGSYKEVQCHGSTGYCWCVNEDGEKRTATEVHAAQPDCSKDA